MKKIMVLMLALSLLTAALLALGEAPEEAPGEEASLSGKWYGDLNGLPLTLTLEENGIYTLEGAGKRAAGIWELRDGFIIRDGDESALLTVSGGILYRSDAGLFFSREEPKTYEPAEVNEAAEAGDFEGYWIAAYTEAGGDLLPTLVTGEDTEIYIEGTTAALGGKLFMGIQIAFSREGAGLVFSDGDLTLDLRLLQDGMMRMDIRAGDTGMRIYLESSLPDGED